MAVLGAPPLRIDVMTSITGGDLRRGLARSAPRKDGPVHSELGREALAKVAGIWTAERSRRSRGAQARRDPTSKSAGAGTEPFNRKKDRVEATTDAGSRPDPEAGVEGCIGVGGEEPPSRCTRARLTQLRRGREARQSTRDVPRGARPGRWANLSGQVPGHSKLRPPRVHGRGVGEHRGVGCSPSFGAHPTGRGGTTAVEPGSVVRQ